MVGARVARYLGMLLLALSAGSACERSRAGPRQADSAEVVRAATATDVAHTAIALNAALDYTPPADSTIRRDELGASIRRGLALVTHTTDSLRQYTPGNIQCVSCHIDGGRRRDAAALMGVTARFPKYMDRTGAVIPVEDRVNYCVTRSLAGTRIPNDSREMQDIVAYLAFLSTGVPQGAHVRGEGMPKMPKLSGDSARGAQLFASTCTACHGTEGQGIPPAFPALWGPKSYSIGASMARQERAATFIRRFMPQTAPGSLTDQQAFDLSAFINSHPRPDSPGKERDWPSGGTPADVPYNTGDHKAFRPPARLIPRGNPSGATVPAPRSIISQTGATVRGPRGR